MELKKLLIDYGDTLINRTAKYNNINYTDAFWRVINEYLLVYFVINNASNLEYRFDFDGNLLEILEK